MNTRNIALVVAALVVGGLCVFGQTAPPSTDIFLVDVLKRGGQPVLRENFMTDNGNLILDVYNLHILEPAKLEAELNNIAGIVTVGLFALRPANVLLLGTADVVQTLHP